MVTKFIAEIWEEKKIKDWTCDEDLNPYITETAGFVPLDVQIQKFEQAGIRAKFTSDMFDSQDLRDMYLGPNTRIFADDDLETINEKLEAQEAIRQSIIQRNKEIELERRRQNFEQSAKGVGEAEDEGNLPK